MTETVLDFEGNVVSQTTYYSREEWEAHLKEEEERLKEEEKKESIKKETNEKMQNKLKVYELGYVNLDKYYNEPMKPFIIAADENIIAEYYLAFKDDRGVMQGNVKDGHVRFGQVPVNRETTLIAVSFIDKQAYYFESSFIAGNKNKPVVSLKAVDESFVDQRLSRLN